MGLSQGIFAVKLYELEQEYGRMQSRLRLVQEKDVHQLQEELDRLQDEYQERKLLLQERIQSSRSPSVAALAQAQLEFGERVEQILREELPNEMHGRNQTSTADAAEAVSLYAEYAIDFSTQTMRYALMVALSALLLQRQAEQETPER